MAVVLVASYLVYDGLIKKDAVQQTPEQTTEDSIRWAFDPAGTEGDMPLTAVSVIAEGRTYDAGTYAGNCFEIAGSGWELLPGERSGAICWWAGGGTELGVFFENGELVVKRGVLEEGSGEIEAVRGDFSTVLVLKESDGVLLKARLTERVRAYGVAITPLEVLEDSRCPADVTCIQAGTVRVRAMVEDGQERTERVFVLGIVETRARESIGLVTVEPAPRAGTRITPPDYRFTFGIEPRE